MTMPGTMSSSDSSEMRKNSHRVYCSGWLGRCRCRRARRHGEGATVLVIGLLGSAAVSPPAYRLLTRGTEAVPTESPQEGVTRGQATRHEDALRATAIASTLAETCSFVRTFET